MHIVESYNYPNKWFIFRSNGQEVEINIVNGKFKAVHHKLTNEEKESLKLIKL